MRTAKATTHRTGRPSVDPYCVQAHTWTRDELLAARGLPTTATATRRRPSSAKRPKAA